MTGDELPEWDREIGAIWIDDLLTKEMRQQLKNSPEKIWPRKCTDEEKDRLLDAANRGLNFLTQQIRGNLSPSDQRKQLETINSSIKKLKSLLSKLDRQTLIFADLAFMEARFCKKPPVKLWDKAQYGDHVESLFTNLWHRLDDTESVLEEASHRIYVDVSNRPENQIYDVVITEIAVAWRAYKGDYPPYSVNGWFSSFVTEVGILLNFKITKDAVIRCIKRMKIIDADLEKEFKK